MSLKCPHCAQENPNGSAFCQFCNSMLSPAAAPTAAAGQQYPGGGYAGQQQQFPYPGGPSQTLQPPVYPGNSGGYAPAPAPVISVPVQMGTGRVKQPFGRRAFAGRGTPIYHHSWLLGGEQAKAEAIFVAARDLLFKRKLEVLEFNIDSKPLTDVGVRADQNEDRLYLILKRGVTTVFLYVAPFGSNLYISRTTTVLPLISLIRVAFLVLTVLLPFVVSAMLQNVPGAALAIPCLIGLFWFPIVVLAIPSIVHGIKEGDFLVYLRTKTLTSFQVDDVMVLERLTDYIVKAAVKVVGLNSDLIDPPKNGYEAKQTVRGF